MVQRRSPKPTGKTPDGVIISRVQDSNKQNSARAFFDYRNLPNGSLGTMYFDGDYLNAFSSVGLSDFDSTTASGTVTATQTGLLKKWGFSAFLSGVTETFTYYGYFNYNLAGSPKYDSQPSGSGTFTFTLDPTSTGVSTYINMPYTPGGRYSSAEPPYNAGIVQYPNGGSTWVWKNQILPGDSISVSIRNGDGDVVTSGGPVTWLSVNLTAGYVTFSADETNTF
jgi:hypothetical protein